MDLKSKSGRLLSCSGHLSTTCCGPCTFPESGFWVRLYIGWSGETVLQGYAAPAGTGLWHAQSGDWFVFLHWSISEPFWRAQYGGGSFENSDYLSPVTQCDPSGDFGLSSAGFNLSISLAPPPGAEPPVPDAEAVDRSRSRFAICRTCADSLQDGSACRLHEGCCFGRLRTYPSFRCPSGKW
jgi:hypothetical protein